MRGDRHNVGMIETHVTAASKPSTATVFSGSGWPLCSQATEAP